MILNYSDEEVKKGQNSIFLAGPTPRSADVVSWRKEAVEILEKLRYDGIVYIPENKDGKPKKSYIDQALWEREALMSAGIIVFYIPRDLKTLPGYTTNVEFGYYITMRKILYGRPNNAEKTKYLDWLYDYELDKKPHTNLESLLVEAVETLREQRRVGFTDISTIINRITGDPDDFYDQVFMNMGILERTYIKKSLFHKTCESCLNASCPIKENGLEHPANCEMWINDILVGKAKITGQTDVIKLIKK